MVGASAHRMSHVTYHWMSHGMSIPSVDLRFQNRYCWILQASSPASVLAWFCTTNCMVETWGRTETRLLLAHAADDSLELFFMVHWQNSWRGTTNVDASNRRKRLMSSQRCKACSAMRKSDVLITTVILIHLSWATVFQTNQSLNIPAETESAAVWFPRVFVSWYHCDHCD